MSGLRFIALTLAVVAIIGVAGYLASTSTSTPPSSTTLSTLSPNPGGSSTASSTSYSPASSFLYAPGSPVKVESVVASTYQGPQGTQVSFSVVYQNIGSSDIYYVTGCGSSLEASVPAGSGVLQKVGGGPVCLCGEVIMPLPPGGNHTASTPGCWSGYAIDLVHSGTVRVMLTINWDSSQGASSPDVTNVTATFTFA